LAVIAVYLLANIAYLRVLGIAGLAATPHLPRSDGARPRPAGASDQRRHRAVGVRFLDWWSS